MSRCAPSLSLLLIIAAVTLLPARYGAAEPAKGAPKAIPLSGKVVETLNGGGYTYILINNGSEKIWVAAPLMKVSVGQQLNLMPGYEMKNFSSKTLNRKFDRVIFTGGVVNQEPAMSTEAIQKAHKGISPERLQAAIKPEKLPAPQKEQISMMTPALPAPPKKVKVARAKGPNAYNIAELYAKKSKLEKKQVVVRGTVVKVSSHILKRNWIHLEDGSGSARKKNNDIIITSSEIPKVGEVVTAKGVLYNDMDFGSGYRYGLIVEGAHFTRK